MKVIKKQWGKADSIVKIIGTDYSFLYLVLVLILTTTVRWDSGWHTISYC